MAAWGWGLAALGLFAIGAVAVVVWLVYRYMANWGDRHG